MRGSLGLVLVAALAACEDRGAAVPAASDAPAVSAAPAPVGSIVAAISVSPEAGKIVVDGAALADNPFRGSLPRDGAVHRLRFEAPGFTPQTRMVVFDKDFAIDARLAPVP